MPKRVPRPDEQIKWLAAELNQLWVPADGIEPWLRRHLPRLDRLVRDEGWIWADVGRAMTAAGITYAGGRPWTGPALTSKIVQVRAQLRKRAAPPVAQRQAEPVARVVAPRAAAFGPEPVSFMLARVAAQPGAAFPPPRLVADPAPVQPRKADPDAVLRKLLGDAAPPPSTDKDQD